VLILKKMQDVTRDLCSVLPCPSKLGQAGDSWNRITGRRLLAHPLLESRYR